MVYVCLFEGLKIKDYIAGYPLSSRLLKMVGYPAQLYIKYQPGRECNKIFQSWICAGQTLGLD